MIQEIRAMFIKQGQGVVDSLMHQVHANEIVVLIDSAESVQDMENSIQIY
jgi:hypothetical protein